MLQVDPGMLGRLTELRTDVTNRHRRAIAEGWLDEIEAINFTLRLLEEKVDEAQRRGKEGRVTLGMLLIRAT